MPIRLQIKDMKKSTAVSVKEEQVATTAAQTTLSGANPALQAISSPKQKSPDG